MTFPELLVAPEGKTLEYKRDLSSLRPVLKSLVAFANTAGGTLVIGRADDGAIVGVAHALAEEERLANVIADGIRPAMTPDIDIVTHDGKPEYGHLHGSYIREYYRSASGLPGPQRLPGPWFGGDEAPPHLFAVSVQHCSACSEMPLPFTG